MHFFKSKYFAILIIALLLVISLSACSNSESKSVSSNSEPIELSLAHFFPGTHPAETDFVKVWAEEIKKATDGKVEITSYPGETLSKAPDIYNNVVKGVADIGLSCFAYTRGRFPVLEAFELPGITYNNSKVASKVAWEGIKKLNPKEIQDTKLLMVIATGPGDLATKEPVKDLNDLQGMEIRATGLSAKTIEALGGTPVAMPQSDAYESLSKGVVKGNLLPVEVLKGWKQAEVTSYLTRTPFLYNTLFFVTMNLEKWNSIPKDIQDIILQVTESVYNENGIGLWDNQNAEAFDWAVNQQDIKVIELSEKEKAKWIDKVTPIQKEYENKLNKLNIDKDVLKIVKDLADKYNKVYK